MKRFGLLFTNIIIAQFRSESDYGALFGLVLPIQIYKPLKIEQHVGVNSLKVFWLKERKFDLFILSVVKKFIC